MTHKMRSGAGLALLIAFGVIAARTQPVRAQTTDSPEYLQNQQNFKQRAVPAIGELRAGPHTGSSEPLWELFVFADLTEEGFSGEVLANRIPALLAKYPGQLRVWYIHTVLPYRDNANLRSAIDTSFCLEEQHVFWDNIQNLVAYDGQHDANYPVPNGEQYNKCITASFQTLNRQTEVVERGQRLMKAYDIIGIPDVLIVHRDWMNQAREVPGVQALAAYEQAMEYAARDAAAYQVSQGHVAASPVVWVVTPSPEQLEPTPSVPVVVTPMPPQQAGWWQSLRQFILKILRTTKLLDI